MKNKEIIEQHFYKSDKTYKVKEQTCRELRDNFEDNHLGRVRDNQYDKEQFYIDERYEQG